MTNHTDLTQLEHWGYSLLPAPHHNCPGYTGIKVMVQDEPNPDAFLSPASLRVHTLDPDGYAYWEVLDISDKRIPFNTICPGKFYVRDKQKNEITFFSFGANIKLEQYPEKVIFNIISDAPILELSQKNSTVVTDFAEEVETQFARLEAKWMLQREDHHDFFAYLAHTFSPFDLYTASIQTLLTHFNNATTLQHDHSQLCHLLKQEKHNLQENEQWPETAPSLEELIA
jgi:hypothetical protein